MGVLRCGKEAVDYESANPNSLNDAASRQKVLFYFILAGVGDACQSVLKETEAIRGGQLHQCRESRAEHAY